MKILFSTQNYTYLKEKLLKIGVFEEGAVEVKTFPDGERYQRIISEIDGKDVVLVGGTVSDADTLELYDLACSIEMYGAHSLILVIPYFGYSTMERATQTREVVTAKTRARLLSAIPKTGGGNHVIMFDLHSEGIPHYFEGNVRPIHLYGKSLVIEAARELGGHDFIMACTDAGRAKWVESLANDLGVSAAFVFKRRLSGESTEITGINADVAGKTVIIYDDMIRTGGSLIKAAEAYQEAGAQEIYAITTHGLFSRGALERIKKNGIIKKIVSTDTHMNAVHLQDEILEIRSIDRLLVSKLNEL